MKRALSLLFMGSSFCRHMRMALFSFAMLLAVSTAFAGQTITISTHVSHNVYGNGSGVNGSFGTGLLDLNENTVIINSGVTADGSVYGSLHYSNSGAVMISTGNNVSITSSVVGLDVYGGRAGNEDFYTGLSSGAATADYNTVNIVDSIINRDANGPSGVFGGFAGGFNHYGTAAANYNSLTLNGVAAGAAVGGAAVSVADFARADNNSMTIIDSDIDGPVWGGFAGGGSAIASSNSITITGSQMGENVVGGYAGRYEDTGNGAFDFTPVDFMAEASSNSVTIIDGAVDRLVSGGIAISDSDSATASRNVVDIDNTTVGDNVLGGAALSNSGLATADNNSVSITDSLGGIIGAICGGFANGASASAANNDVTITNSWAINNIYGGIAVGDSAMASSNSVTITGSQINGDVYGGFVGLYDNSGVPATIMAKANNNSITIMNGTVDGLVSGGYAMSDSDSATADKNRVIINSVMVSGDSVYGGVALSNYGLAAADNNSVEITGSLIHEEIFGGFAGSRYNSASAANNDVTITDSWVNNVFGGFAGWNSSIGSGPDTLIAAANDNRVKITGTVVGNEMLLMYGDERNVYGGHALINSGLATANNDSVDIDSAAVYGSVYGGYAKSDMGAAMMSSGNNVFITSGSISLDVYGGRAGNEDFFIGLSSGAATADYNTINIVNSIINKDSNGPSGIFGGFAGGFEHYGTATAKYNSVTIDSVTAGAAVGGAAISVSDFADAKNNSITIINSGISGPVWGGFAGGDSAMASSNSITITGSQMGENVVGGYAGRYEDDGTGSGNFGFTSVDFMAEASGNSVTIIDGAVDRLVSGGIAISDSDSATASRNVVDIDNTTVGDNVLGGAALSNSGLATADNNSVRITDSLGGIIGAICGGFANGASASAANNDVTITDSDIYGPVWGGYAGGSSAETSSNSVTITGSQINGDVYGGVAGRYGNSGVPAAIMAKANNNSITIMDGTVDGLVCGAYAISDSDSATADKNRVIINSVMVSGDSVYGGVALSNYGLATADNNSVEITGSSYIQEEIFGGFAGSIYDSASAANNDVTITDSWVNNVFGSFAGWNSSIGSGPDTLIAAANDNRVKITGTVVGNEMLLMSGDERNVYGGHALINSGLAAANNDSVDIDSAAVYGSVYGGYAKSDMGAAMMSSGNNVFITSGSISLDVYGGRAGNEDFFIGLSSGAATADYNTINIVNSIINKDANGPSGIFGGFAGGFEHYGTATAKYNSVTIDSVTAGAAVGGAAISVSDFADAKNNSITIINSGISGPVWGGFAGGDSAMASSNSITITGSQTGENVIGGYAGLYGDDGSGSFGFFPVPFRAEAYNNSITIVDSIVSSGSIYGGRAYSDASYAYAHNNNVTMTGGTVGDIYGGYADSNHNMASADNNSVTITNITMGAPGYAASVCGGYAYSGYDSVMASNNSVTIDSVTLNGNVSGGYAMLDGSNSGKYASALYNTVTIIGENGGKIVGNIYGGYSPINVYNGEIGIAIHNTVNIVGAGTDLTEAVIFGGFVGNGNNNFDVLTGNTLNITGSDIRVSGIRNFYNYNFYLPETIADGDTMLTALRGDGTDNAVNISNSTVGMGFVGSTAPDINAGDTITLIDTNGNGLTATGINSTAQALLGSITKLYEFDLIVDSNCLYATYTGVNGVNPKMKILSEGVAAGAILAVRTADNINGGLLSGLKGDKVEAIASIFGGKSKYDTGSSVEMSAFGAAAGIAKKFDSGSAGIFVEYANGTFDTEYDGLDGDGSASTIGLGVLAKKDITDNFYVEGLIRVGQLSNDYKSTVSGVSTDFDYDSMYFGASVGAGRIFDVNEKMSVDVFGKYALTNIGESDVKLKTGDKYEFDSILSNSIKAGAKGEYKINDALKPYLVLSYDYELSGDVDAKINGMEIESPTLNGGTFSGGLGVNAKVAEKLTLDLSAQLYTGVREGIIGGLRIKYEF